MQGNSTVFYLGQEDLPFPHSIITESYRTVIRHGPGTFVTNMIYDVDVHQHKLQMQHNDAVLECHYCVSEY